MFSKPVTSLLDAVLLNNTIRLHKQRPCGSRRPLMIDLALLNNISPLVSVAPVKVARKLIEEQQTLNSAPPP